MSTKKQCKTRNRVKIEKRKVDWYFIIVFLLGAVFSEITSDVFSDLAFFIRTQTNPAPLTPEESVLYWYYYPALAYFLLFVGALTLMYIRKVPAEIYKYVIIIFAGIAFVFSLKVLGFGIWVIVLLSIPFIFLYYILNYVTIIQSKKRNIRI